MAAFLQTQYSLPAQLKWPNDILVDGAKICGLIATCQHAQGQLRLLVLGIGLNLNNDPRKLSLATGRKVTSVAALLGHRLAYLPALAGLHCCLSEHLERFWSMPDARAVYQAWSEYAACPEQVAFCREALAEAGLLVVGPR